MSEFLIKIFKKDGDIDLLVVGQRELLEFLSTEREKLMDENKPSPLKFAVFEISHCVVDWS